MWLSARTVRQAVHIFTHQAAHLSLKKQTYIMHNFDSFFLSVMEHICVAQQDSVASQREGSSDGSSFYCDLPTHSPNTSKLGVGPVVTCLSTVLPSLLPNPVVLAGIDSSLHDPAKDELLDNGWMNEWNSWMCWMNGPKDRQTNGKKMQRVQHCPLITVFPQHDLRMLVLANSIAKWAYQSPGIFSWASVPPLCQSLPRRRWLEFNNKDRISRNYSLYQFRCCLLLLKNEETEEQRGDVEAVSALL